MFIVITLCFGVLPVCFAQQKPAETVQPSADKKAAGLVQPPADNKIKCPKCGYQNSAGDRYCIECAAELRQMSEDEKKQAEITEQENRERAQKLKDIIRSETEYRKKQEFEEAKKLMISSGRIAYGMTPEEVLQAWGNPSRIIQMADGSVVWRYVVSKYVTVSGKKYIKEDLARYAVFKNGTVAEFNIAPAEDTP